MKFPVAAATIGWGKGRAGKGAVGWMLVAGCQGSGGAGAGVEVEVEVRDEAKGKGKGKGTPPQPSPALRAREGVEAAALRSERPQQTAPSLARSAGEGWGGVLRILHFHRTISAHALNSANSKEIPETQSPQAFSINHLKSDSASGVIRFPSCSLHRALLGIKLTGNRP